MTRHHAAIAATLGVLAAVAWFYSPVRHGDFIWDDQLCFHDAAWLRSDGWIHYLFRDFCNWTDYFRPLSVFVLAIQVRWFDAAASPMHLVSLALHLLNTSLVAALAWQLQPRAASVVRCTLAALIYGLHPVLIEPVYWVGCQYEMLVTLFILLGLLANSCIRSDWPRALAVAGCFFLAACSKESAVAFPLLLLILDRITSAESDASISALMRRQWRTYSCVAAAGFSYLALRYWMLGTLPHAGAASLELPVRVAKASLAYLSYWKLLLWPMSGLGPIHPLDPERLHGWPAIAACAATMAILLGAFHAFVRGRAIGAAVLAVTAALLPVLHIVPITFNESLYHERYAMTALAMACVLLPMVLGETPMVRLSRFIAPPLTVAWLILAIVQIRVNLPLWTDELKLWEWAVRENPASLDAKQHLLAKYMERHDRAHAYQVAHMLMQDPGSCPVCMLSIAYLALGDNDPALANAAMERIKAAPALPKDPLFLQEFVVANGGLLELQHEPAAAETAYRDAMSMNPLDPQPPQYLALLLLREGKPDQARAAAATADALLASDRREAWHTTFGQAVAGVKTP